MPLSRRAALLCAAAVTLPRPGMAQADQRPSITIAVQKVVNSNTLEMAREQSNVGTRVFNSYSEMLIDTDWIGDLSLRPGLATAWRRIDDRTVELDLREGVRFHNGDLMTAEDVAFSFGPDRLWGAGGRQAGGALFAGGAAGAAGKAPPPEVSAIARRTYPGFERIEILGPHKVRFVNRTPDITLEGRIARNVGLILSERSFSEAESWLAWARRPVGTGPYRVAEFRPDRDLMLEAFDEYWGGRPPVRRIRFVEVPEPASRVNGLLSGEFDFACDVNPDQIADVERNPRFEVVGSTITNHRLTVFDRNHPQLRDARVRRAFTHAIDRQMIVDALWAGRTRIPKGLQWDYYGEMLQADWAVPAFDPAEARRLLREAGYRGEPIPYRLLNNYYTNQVATAQILVEMWRQVGLNVQIEMKENWAQIFDRNAPRAVRDWSNSAVFNDPVSSLTAAFGPEGQNQQVGEWRNEEFNRLSVELETGTDRARRRLVFRRMLEIAEREDPVYTVLHQTATFTAKRKDIRWRAAQSFLMDFRSSNWGA
ncbi:ABC transporter substrate-binding protein [Neoroseomonas eburnea]|nr:ABC transporter substrate-binding protein [Neoroseomonas eburnea]